MIKQETALPSALYELLSVLHLLGILALQEANDCLTAKATADGYLPRVTEGKKKNFHHQAVVGHHNNSKVFKFDKLLVLTWHELGTKLSRMGFKLDLL
jgi:hypothetical protein